MEKRRVAMADSHREDLGHFHHRQSDPPPERCTRSLGSTLPRRCLTKRSTPTTSSLHQR
ncbi:hypothetical protein M6B38_409470 [Iris pallida]|uniref:Uncharacterized protein n=1 Tax=Iris pallida TaxID=29817 RepID=A0AAX6FP50_IRIPA|nr:hypothetical protein M6B38_409470 [Iris pallida]